MYVRRKILNLTGYTCLEKYRSYFFFFNSFSLLIYFYLPREEDKEREREREATHTHTQSGVETDFYRFDKGVI